MEAMTEAERAKLDKAEERPKFEAVSDEEEEEEEKEEKPALIGARISIDVALASLGAIGIYLYRQLGAGVLTKTGFHCADETLAYPYHSSTIPSWLNGVVGVVVPVCIVVADGLVEAGKKAKLNNKSIASTFLKMFPILIAFLAGCSLQHIFTDVAKYEVGRLRPHFFAVCQPKFEVGGELLDCSSPNIRGYEYISNFTCTSNYSSSRQKEARISFPSGHCSFAFFTMTFAFIYVHFRLPMRFSTFLGVIPRPFLQFSCLWWAWFVGISRFFDNKHHASDILAGGLIGVLVAVFFAVVVLRLHQRRRRRRRGEEDEPRRGNFGSLDDVTADPRSVAPRP